MTLLAPAPPGTHPVPGDLKAALAGDRLLVPREVLEALSGQRLRSAEDLHTYLSSFPTSCAKLFHWSVGDCLAAADRLGATLGLARQPQRPRPGMGAMNPDLLPK